MKHTPTEPALPAHESPQHLKPNQGAAFDIEKIGSASEQHVIDGIVAMITSSRDYQRVFINELQELGLTKNFEAAPANPVQYAQPQAETLYEQIAQPNLEETRQQINRLYQQDGAQHYVAGHPRVGYFNQSLQNPAADSTDQALQDMGYSKGDYDVAA